MIRVLLRQLMLNWPGNLGFASCGLQTATINLSGQQQLILHWPLSISGAGGEQRPLINDLIGSYRIRLCINPDQAVRYM